MLFMKHGVGTEGISTHSPQSDAQGLIDAEKSSI
jgi:hypothetical protein